MSHHKDLKQLRHELHREPELSGNEKKTANRIAEELASTLPDELIRGIGGTGIAAIYNGHKEDLTVMFRAELDALPILELSDLSYVSQVPGVSHKCGHDGHMTALVGLAQRISEMRHQLSGRVVLLFQPAEEVAAGAAAVVADPRFEEIRPDRIFAWHNLPGFPLGSVIVRNGVFAAASRGLVVRLLGKTSHAAHTEDGISPLPVVTHLLNELPRLPQDCVRFDHAARVTVIHVRLGEIAFGTSPGEAEVMATFRTHQETDMARMMDRAESMIASIAHAHGLQFEMEWRDKFPATVSDDTCVACVRHAAEAVKADIVEAATAFPWSEDFGVFTREIPGAFFGIGSGTSQPQLHHPDYDFPDELLSRSVDVMWELINKVSGSSSCT
ncbi:MAG: amidohydrolase [Acidobacteria bacterium CG_4_9_14_3_um_filter_49_7]|nr:MAG: amidohydrolase [Acidobacteria bacterium CG_4_9_14_3_um_filter_49_7]